MNWGVWLEISAPFVLAHRLILRDKIALTDLVNSE